MLFCLRWRKLTALIMLSFTNFSMALTAYQSLSSKLAKKKSFKVNIQVIVLRSSFSTHFQRSWNPMNTSIAKTSTHSQLASFPAQTMTFCRNLSMKWKICTNNLFWPFIIWPKVNTNGKTMIASSIVVIVDKIWTRLPWWLKRSQTCFTTTVRCWRAWKRLSSLDMSPTSNNLSEAYLISSQINLHL